MANLREWIARVTTPFRRRALDRQTETEMRFHLDMEIEAGLRRGLSREAAEREARLRAGSLPAAMEAVRDQRGMGGLDGTWADLRHAWSSLRRRPGFLMVAGGALACAVAANTLIFTVVNGVLLRPLPYASPERLVRIYEATPRNPKFPISLLNYLEDKRESRTLEGIALYTRDDLQLMHGEQAERLTTVRITDDFLPLLGVTPALGRNFLPSEMRTAARVVMLGHSTWLSRFHADPNIAGSTVRLNRENWTVVGVMPAGFQHVGGDYRSPLQGDTVALWSPLGLDLPPQGQRNWHFTNAIARLKPGVSITAASEDLNRIMDDLAKRYPNSYGEARARIEPLATEVVGRSRNTVQIVMAAGAMVLLVACINIAGLSVARALARRRELAIRQALGGSGWRLVRYILSENLIAGVLGGAAGVGLAAALAPVLHVMIPADFPRLHEVGFSPAAAAFACAIALLTATAAGLAPALRQLRVDPRDGLAEEGRLTAASHRAGSLRGGLVAAEIAIACVLCFGALLLARSSRQLQARDHGFDSDHVLTFELSLPEAAYRKPEQLNAFYSEIVRRWYEIPGVRAAGLTTALPWTGYDENTGFDIVGRAPRPGESIQARFQAATPGFFEALRFRLLDGRFIEPGDNESAAKVVVVNDSFARRYFAEHGAVGRELDLWGAKRRIVGVVADIRDRPADRAAEPAFWWPLQQQQFGSMRAVLRTEGDPLGALRAVRAAVESTDRELPLFEIRTMDDIASQALAERRFALWLCEVFALVAMALAAIGLYGILSYVVQQRRREIGIRMALGAGRPAMLWLVFSNGLALAGMGIGAALVISPAAGRSLAAMLFGVGTLDLTALISAPLIILLMALAGSLAPAWRAARCEPVAALREQ